MSTTDPILLRLQAMCVKREYCSSDILKKAYALCLKSTESLDDSLHTASSDECFRALDKDYDGPCLDKSNCHKKAEQLLQLLIKDKFVSDYRYACAFAREKSSLTGWGPIKIKTALLTKGIDSDTIAQALEEIDGSKAEDKLVKLLQNKWRTLKEDPYGKFKLLKYALSRGYQYDQIRSLVDKIVDEEA